MLFLVILVIALGWAGWVWAWSRDRFISGSGIGLPGGALSGRPPSALAAPRTPTMARKRRREVLAALVVAALFTLLLARSWSVLWAVHLLVDVALIAYGWAVFTLESNGAPRNVPQQSGPLLRTPRLSLQPIVDERTSFQPGPRR